MKRFIYFNLFMLIASVAFTVPTQGQEALRLQDAIAIALEENFDIRIEKLREEIAVNNNTWGNAGLFPQLSLVANQQNGYNDQDNPASFINGQFETHSINVGAEANWTLFNGFRVYVNKDRLKTL